MNTFGVRSVHQDEELALPCDFRGQNMYNDALLFEKAPFLMAGDLPDAKVIQ